MENLHTTDINNNPLIFFYELSYEDIYHCDKHRKGLDVSIYADKQKTGDFFSLRLVDENTHYKIVDITHNDDDRYRKKGIPEAILYELSHKLDTQIRSSRNLNKECSDERRSPEADKYWIRICEMGKAEYSNEDDYYYMVQIK